MLAQIQGLAQLSNCVFVQILFELLDFLARLKFTAPRPAFITGKQTFDYADLPRLGNQSFNWGYQEKLWLTISTIYCKHLLVLPKNVGAFNIEGQRLFASHVVQTSPAFCCLSIAGYKLWGGGSQILQKRNSLQISMQMYVRRKNS